MCRWLLSSLAHEHHHEGMERTLLEVELTIQHVAPDAEGCCPSDLAGMEGHHRLVKWLSAKEQALVVKHIFTVGSTGMRNAPEWLVTAVENESVSGGKYNVKSAETFWGAGGGVRRMAISLLHHRPHSNIR